MDIAAAQSSDRNHPAGLALLFLTEMLECFAYYGVRSLLVLYLIAKVEDGGLNWSSEDATQLYGLFTGFVFITPILGGILADRYFGAQKAVILGAGIAAMGYASLTLVTEEGFYLGLLLVVIGTGLMKPNVAMQVGRLYDQHDSRRDSAYTIFYLGINLGALLGPFICGYLAMTPGYGWNYGFAASALAITLGWALFALCKNRFLEVAKERELAATNFQETRAFSCDDRQRVLALSLMSAFVVFFWLAFEQTGSSMTLFAEAHTDRATPTWMMSLGVPSEFPAAWFQMVNPAMILLCAPFLSMLWLRLARRRREPAPLAKMCIGLVLLGLGFLVLVVGAHQADQGVQVRPLWLACTYLLHAWAELCFSPVGLSLVSRVAPARFASMMMAVAFLCYGIANLIAGFLASSLERVQHGEFFSLLGGQADFFLIFVVTSWLAAVGILFLLPMFKRLS